MENKSGIGLYNESLRLRDAGKAEQADRLLRQSAKLGEPMAKHAIGIFSNEQRSTTREAGA